MRGDLSDDPAADVCRALARAGANGVLQLEAPAGRGTIVYEGGQVVAATSPAPRARIGHRLVHRGHLAADVLDEVLAEQARAGQPHRVGAMLVERGLVDHAAVRDVVQEQVVDAVFEVLGWRYGTYLFEPGGFGALDVVPEVPLRLRVDQLLTEVARRRDEWDELHRVLPDLEAVPRFPDGGGATPEQAFEADALALLASVDGVRSVRALADDLGFGRFEAARIVYALATADVLAIDLPEDEVGRALEEALGGRDSAPPAPDPTGEPGGAAPAVTDEATAAEVTEPTAEPAAPEPSEVGEEEITALTDISRLLAELETDVMGPRSYDEPPAPDDAAGAEGTPPTSPPAVEPATERPDTVEHPPTPRPAPPAATPRPAGEEISELLRELSQLAAADDGEPPLDLDPVEPEAADPDTEPGDDHARRRRRFGRG